ncbi:metallophosphoesterase family protein [Sporosarcina sp. SAFN-015]|uniref:metallophosphoesterase family protein n=1 Tax=Sporosarcina sp. SAFN-015 TaxID=3387274 RepID=UPI003F7D2598
MKRTLVISDIHGELELFEELLQRTGYDSTQDQLVLLGDYIDRGPHSKEVLDKVMELKSEGAIVLKGNHDEMLVKAFRTNEERAWKNWTNRNGGDATLKSYGFSEEEFKVGEEEPFVKPEIHSVELEEHIQFIQTLDYYLEWDDTIFVHAGVHPEKPVEETDPYELIWIRDVFHNGYNGEKTVIFGHTPTKNLHKDKQGCSVFFGENRIIGIDGAAVYGGQLNCLQLPEKIVYSVTAKEKKNLKKGEVHDKQTV